MINRYSGLNCNDSEVGDKQLYDNISDFTRTARTWHNSVVVLKQQLQQLAAVIGSGLIQALKPFVNAMNNALSGLIKFAQNVVNALGKIFGWEMEVNTSGLQMDEDAYDVDTSGLDDVADKAGKAGKATDGAAKSAKKLKEQLQGFDKLNVIRSEDTSGSDGSGGGGGGGGGSGSGGGGGGTSGGDVSASLKKTKGMFESDIDNLFDLGRYISDSLATQLESIQWEKIYSKARGFGTGLAQFLNGLITPRLFADLGRTVADCINTAFEFLNSFGTEFDWGNFGYSIGIGINAHLREYNWGTILNAAKVWGKGLANTINKAVSTTSFALVGKTLALQLRTAFTFLYNFGDTLEWGKIGQSIAEGINSFIENFPASQFANTIDAWVQGIADLAAETVKNIDYSKLAEKIREFISSIDPGTVSIVLKTLALVKGASFGISIGSTLINAVCQEFIRRLAARLVVSMAGSKLLQGAIGGGLGSAASSSGPMLGQAIGGGFLSSLAGIVGAIGGVVIAAKGLFDIWKKGWSASKGIMVAAGTGISMVALGIIGVLTGPLALAIAGVTAAFTFLAANHKTIVEGMKKKASEFSQSWQKLKDDASQVGTALKDTWTTIKTDFGQLASDVAKKAADLGNKVKTKFEDMKSNASTKVSTLKTTITNKFQEIKTNAGSKIETLKSQASTAWTNMQTTASSKLKTLGTTVKDKFETVRSTVSEKLSSAKSSVASAWDDMKTAASKKLGENGVLGTVKKKFKDIKEAITDKLPVNIGNIIHFKKPSISLTTASKTVLGKTITYPTGFDVTWHRKGYNNPLMFTQPTLVPSLNGFGDGNGGEIVYGHSNLMDDIREASGSYAMTDIGNKQLANDQRIIQLLSVIAEKEYGISSRELFKSVRNEANYYRRRTGRGAFEY